jgi:hypothetical protein
MPRKVKQQPGPGGAYANRTDMAQPVQAPTGLPYGERQALEQAQQEAPVPATPDPFDRILAAAQQFPMDMGPINRPTERPNEPVTAGLRAGPGPGPEVLGMPTGISDTLARIYGESGNETIAALLDRARQMGL